MKSLQVLVKGIKPALNLGAGGSVGVNKQVCPQLKATCASHAVLQTNSDSECSSSLKLLPSLCKAHLWDVLWCLFLGVCSLGLWFVMELCSCFPSEGWCCAFVHAAAVNWEMHSSLHCCLPFFPFVYKFWHWTTLGAVNLLILPRSAVVFLNHSQWNRVLSAGHTIGLGTAQYRNSQVLWQMTFQFSLLVLFWYMKRTAVNSAFLGMC